jgi:hypothetical protein
MGIVGIDVVWKLWGAIGAFIADRQSFKVRRWFRRRWRFFLHPTRQFRVFSRRNEVLIVSCTISDHISCLFD